MVIFLWFSVQPNKRNISRKETNWRETLGGGLAKSLKVQKKKTWSVREEEEEVLLLGMKATFVFVWSHCNVTHCLVNYTLRL